MERFKVSFNNQQHTLGVSEPGVVSIIVSAVSRENDVAEPRHECRIELGGLDSNSGTHLGWAKHDLCAGDKIEIEVLADGQSDQPAVERRPDPQVDDERKKDYVRQLAMEFGWKIVERE